MAKKKKTIELSSENLTFTLERTSYKILRFNTQKMTLEVTITEEDGSKKQMKDFPFAHLPKEMKKKIKPN